MRFEPRRHLHGFHLAVERLLHRREQRFIFLVRRLVRLFLVLKAEVARGDRLELLILKAVQHLQRKFIHIVGQIQNFKAVIAHRLGLRQLFDLVGRVAAGIIDILLPFCHPLDIFMQRDELFLLGGDKQDEILQHILVHAVVVIDAEFQLQTEALIELFIGLAVVFEHRQQLAVDLLFQSAGDDLQLTVVLQHLAGNVQRQILRVDKALHKAEMIRQKIRALVHDQHAAGV